MKTSPLSRLLPKPSCLLAVGFSLLASGAPGTALADRVDELVEQYQIQKDIDAQYQECLEGAVQALEMDLQSGIAEEEFDIERGDPDWALLGAIYSEYYLSVCSYLKGDFIVDFYRADGQA